MANFYIADTHFGHENVLEFGRRPFADLGEMETALVRNWDRAVTEAGPGNIYNVGCMIPWMDYTPRTLDEIVARKTAWKMEGT